MLQDVKDLTASGVMKGLNTQYNLLALQKDQSPNMMDVKINYDGSIEKRLGSTTQNTVMIVNSAAAGFLVDSASLLIPLLTSYWTMDEASGTRKDNIGSYNLTDSGGTLYASGIRNQAALFNASCSQFLYVNNPTLLTGHTSFSISAQVYLNSTSPTLQRTIASKWLYAPVTYTDNAIPLMTSDNAPSGNVYRDSANDSTHEGWVAFSRSTLQGQKWISAFSSFPHWLCYKFPSTKIIIRYTLFSSTTLPKDWTFQGSNDTTDGLDGSWTTLDTQTGQNPTTKTIYTFANTTPYLAYKIHITKNTNDDTVTGNVYINELEMMERAAGEIKNFEYWVYVDTDNKAVFDVSSSGIAANGSVRANSYGALLVGSWYNIVASVANNSAIGISVNLSENNSAYTAGIITTTVPFVVGATLKSGSGYFMDGRIDEVGFWQESLSSQNKADLYNVGSGNSYAPSFMGYPWASFDFGASSIRWLTCAAGTGVYASSNLGLTWVNIATDRSATYQYLDRSKNVEILTSDAYDNPLYWAGSAGTFASVIGTSTPLCKYSINFQGFLILLNSQARKRSFNYIDENFQLSSTAWLNFDLPSSADDEITACFVLRRYLYVSTRYKIYRVSYVGGNPDWRYDEIKSWGFVPRTVKKVVIMNNAQNTNSSYSIGEVVIGLSYDRKLKIFDGSGDQILSNNIEKDNAICDFALDKIPYVGSGPILSFAELDPIPNVYKLCVAIGQDSRQTTHFINYDGRSQALYPYSNMPFNTMCVAESANRQFLMAFDRNGYCHMMDSGNLDGGVTPINDYYESPLLFEKSPSQSSKGHKTDIFFSNTSCGNVHYADRTDFSNTFKERKNFVISGSAQKVVHYESVDVPESYNTYQFRISSSSGTNKPWRMQRYDHFVQGLGIGRNA